jgi:hypothetical protein
MVVHEDGVSFVDPPLSWRDVVASAAVTVGGLLVFLAFTVLLTLRPQLPAHGVSGLLCPLVGFLVLVGQVLAALSLHRPLQIAARNGKLSVGGRRRARTWEARQIRRIRVRSRDVDILKLRPNAVLEIELTWRRIALLRRRDPSEVRWMAGRLNAALGLT